jgi:hypothetical protein
MNSATSLAVPKGVVRSKRSNGVRYCASIAGASMARASSRDAPTLHQNCIPSSTSRGSRPAATAASAILSFARASRSTDCQMPVYPSPKRPARRNAASLRPPTNTGTGPSGFG